MDLAYAAADFALCRAGAMTCAELTAVGLPAAFVPLPHGNGEQRLNAAPIVAGGGGLLVDDADLTPEWIRDVLLPVLLDIDRVANMSEAAAGLGRADADRALARAVIEVVEAAERESPVPPQAPATAENAEHWFDPAARGAQAGTVPPGSGPSGPGPSGPGPSGPGPSGPGRPQMMPGDQPMPGRPQPGPGPSFAPAQPGATPGGPPWAEAEPQPDPGPRHGAPGRRGQPRHGRPRRGS
jgi:UDP-N-acetylglucosamine--N-acetylmuramyl-(pentapeptide) pyrophosphoryl-undecaprenol N-acetylglucosamine transferase